MLSKSACAITTTTRYSNSVSIGQRINSNDCAAVHSISTTCSGICSDYCISSCSCLQAKIKQYSSACNGIAYVTYATTWGGTVQSYMHACAARTIAATTSHIKECW